MYCDQCGTEIRSGAKHCHNCGARLINDTRSSNSLTEMPSANVKANNGNRQREITDENAQQAPLDQSKEFFGGTYHPWRRLFARTVDLFSIGLGVFILFSFLVAYLFPQNVDGYVKAIANPIIAGIILYLLWLPVEAAFLAVTGTTPAKWIFGIRVLSNTGDKLSYPNALKRAFWVWIQGEGLSIAYVTLFTRLFAYRRLTKTGTTLWDTSVDSVVTHKKWGVIRTIASVLAVLIVLVMMGSILAYG